MKALSYVARRASQRPKSSLSRIVAIDKKNHINFTQAYDDALSACNGAMTSRDIDLSKTTQPNVPPVSNQRWNFSG